MNDPFLGEIALVSFNFAPRNWARCEGQILSIAQNQALFALLGTTYGGNGVTTFALPDLRGRVAIHSGTHPLGEKAGTESTTVVLSQMPAHVHPLNLQSVNVATLCYNGAADQRSPVGNVPAVEVSGVTATYSNAAPDASMNTSGIQVTPTATVSQIGGTQPHENRQPTLVLTYCIALQGVFPSQN